MHQFSISNKIACAPKHLSDNWLRLFHGQNAETFTVFLRNFPLDNFRFYLKNPEIFTVFSGPIFLRKSKHCNLQGSENRIAPRRRKRLKKRLTSSR